VVLANIAFSFYTTMVVKIEEFLDQIRLCVGGLAG